MAADEWTPERLQDVCKEWQALLRLQDWDIKTEVVNPIEIDGDYAECGRATRYKRRGWAKLGDPALFTDEMKKSFSGDPEVSIAHEMLHFVLWPLQDALLRIQDAGAVLTPYVTMAYGEYKDAEERAIDVIAQAMVKLKRGGGGSP